MKKGSFVIVFAGTCGSGKSSVLHRVAEMLDGAPILKFDEYERFMNGWPEDLKQWLADGADANQFKNLRMLRDIQFLLLGESITHPNTNRPIIPAQYLFIEDPFGKQRSAFAKYYDYLVFVDTPQDVALCRMVKRWIKNKSLQQDGAAAEERKEATPEQLLELIETSLNRYLVSHRELYTLVSSKTKQNADLIINGLKPVEELETEVVNNIRNVQKK